MFKTDKKKTCRKCEHRWWRSILRMMVRDRRLTPLERMGARTGYMGVGFLIAAPITWYLIQSWLADFAFHIDLKW